MWASVGFLLPRAGDFISPRQTKPIPIDPIVYALANVTDPVAGITHAYFDFPRGLRAVEIENAATYALIGLMLTTIRRRHRPLEI